MEWKLYHKCWLPQCAPHESPDLSCVMDGSIWRRGGLLARWTSNFDCPEETGWYYIIKDTPFSMEQVNGNARNRLRKGLKNFTVREIVRKEYAEQVCDIYLAAFTQYSATTRPTSSRDEIKAILPRDISMGYRAVGAFSIPDGRLCGFATFRKNSTYYDFSELKALPEAEKLNVNAVLVFGRLEAIKEDIADGIYGCSGETNVVHKTAYQDYLVEKFAFRKVNCHLHLAYNPKIKWMVMALYPFRRLLKGWNVRILDLVYAVLKMEEISRHCKKLRGER